MNFFRNAARVRTRDRRRRSAPSWEQQQCGGDIDDAYAAMPCPPALRIQSTMWATQKVAGSATAALIEQGATLLTGLAAAVAAFATLIPGYSRRVILLPLVPLSVWIGAVAAGAVQEYALAGGGVLAGPRDWSCVRTILVGTAVPGVVMGVMLRRGAPVMPRVSAAFGALAAAGLGNLGVCLFHPHSSSLILLLWHCGTVLVLVAVAGIAGTQLLRWPPQARPLFS